MGDLLNRHAIAYAEAVKAHKAAQNKAAAFDIALSRVDSAPILGTYFQLTESVKAALRDQLFVETSILQDKLEDAEGALQSAAKEA